MVLYDNVINWISLQGKMQNRLTGQEKALCLLKIRWCLIIFGRVMLLEGLRSSVFLAYSFSDWIQRLQRLSWEQKHQSPLGFKERTSKEKNITWLPFSSDHTTACLVSQQHNTEGCPRVGCTLPLPNSPPICSQAALRTHLMHTYLMFLDTAKGAHAIQAVHFSLNPL